MDIFVIDYVDYVFGDVFGMVVDVFDGFGYLQGIDGIGDGVWVFYYEGDEVVGDGMEVVVDVFVLFDQFQCLLVIQVGEGVKGVVQLVYGLFGDQVYGFIV